MKYKIMNKVSHTAKPYQTRALSWLLKSTEEKGSANLEDAYMPQNKTAIIPSIDVPRKNAGRIGFSRPLTKAITSKVDQPGKDLPIDKRIEKLTAKLKQTEQQIRWLCMSQSNSATGSVNLFPYKEEIRRLTHNEDRLSKIDLEHKIIATLVEMGMKKLALKAPRARRQLRSGSLAEDYIRGKNLGFLLDISKNNRNLLRNNTTLCQPRNHLYKKCSTTASSIFLTSPMLTPDTSPKHNEVLKPQRLKIKWRKRMMAPLGRILKDYNDLSLEFKNIKALGREEVQKYNQALEHTNNKVEALKRQRILIHKILGKKPF